MANQITYEHFIKFRNTPLSEDYLLIKKLYNGITGDVYKVQHKKSQKIRCLKTYKKKMIVKQDVNKFLEEIKLIKRFDHPHIFIIYDFYEDSQNYYLVSEFLKGGELFDYLAKVKRITEHEAYKVMKILLTTVNYMHSHNIIHRDIKPENIMLAKENDLESLKMIDFGTAAEFDTGKIFQIPQGTIYYIAPEVLRRSYDCKADVWSCGVIFYMMLCGYPPFNGDSDLEIVQNILQQELMFPNEEWGFINKEIKDLISKMLEKMPHKRISIQECLQHPWFLRNEKENGIPKQIILNKLSQVQKKNKIEKAVRLFIIQNQDWDQQKRDLINIFHSMDLNKDGEVSESELKQILVKGKINVDIEKLMREIDLNENGLINFSEFLTAFYDCKKSFQSTELKKLFQLIDTNGDQFITRQELMRFLGLEQDEQLLDDIFEYVDENSDNKISYSEFLRAIDCCKQFVKKKSIKQIKYVYEISQFRNEHKECLKINSLYQKQMHFNTK